MTRATTTVTETVTVVTISLSLSLSVVVSSVWVIRPSGGLVVDLHHLNGGHESRGFAFGEGEEITEWSLHGRYQSCGKGLHASQVGT